MWRRAGRCGRPSISATRCWRSRTRPAASPRGVSAELARALAERLGVPVKFVIYKEAGDVAAAAARDEWDVAFLAIDPVRAATIDYTAPYVLIEGVYAVPASSKLDSVEAVDAARGAGLRGEP